MTEEQKRTTHLSRDEAWELLTLYNKDAFHLQHAETVEKTMRWFARELGYAEEEDYWGIVGIDYPIFAIECQLPRRDFYVRMPGSRQSPAARENLTRRCGAAEVVREVLKISLRSLRPLRLKLLRRLTQPRSSRSMGTSYVQRFLDASVAKRPSIDYFADFANFA